MGTKEEYSGVRGWSRKRVRCVGGGVWEGSLMKGHCDVCYMYICKYILFFLSFSKFSGFVRGCSHERCPQQQRAGHHLEGRPLREKRVCSVNMSGTVLGCTNINTFNPRRTY